MILNNLLFANITISLLIIKCRTLLFYSLLLVSLAFRTCPLLVSSTSGPFWGCSGPEPFSECEM